MPRKRNPILAKMPAIYKFQLEMPVEMGERLVQMAIENGTTRRAIMLAALSRSLEDWDPTREKRCRQFSNGQLAEMWRMSEKEKREQISGQLVAKLPRTAAEGGKKPAPKLFNAMGARLAPPLAARPDEFVPGPDFVSRMVALKQANPGMNSLQASLAVQEEDRRLAQMDGVGESQAAPAQPPFRIGFELGYQHDGVQSPVPPGPPVDMDQAFALQRKRETYMRMANMLPKGQREIYIRETNERLAELGELPLTAEELLAANRQAKGTVNVMPPAQFGPKVQSNIKHQVAAKKMVPTAIEKVVASGAIDPSGAIVDLDEVDAAADAEKLAQALADKGLTVETAIPAKSDLFSRLFKPGGTK